MSKIKRAMEKTVTTALPVVEQKSTPQPPKIEVKYRDVVYVGVSEEAARFGAVTKTEYIFLKDKFGMPTPTKVDEKDYDALIAENDACCGRKDKKVFISKFDWDMEIERFRRSNR